MVARARTRAQQRESYEPQNAADFHPRGFILQIIWRLKSKVDLIFQPDGTPKIVLGRFPYHFDLLHRVWGALAINRFNGFTWDENR